MNVTSRRFIVTLNVEYGTSIAIIVSVFNCIILITRSRVDNPPGSLILHTSPLFRVSNGLPLLLVHVLSFLLSLSFSINSHRCWFNVKSLSSNYFFYTVIIPVNCPPVEQPCLDSSLIPRSVLSVSERYRVSMVQ
jgi:hypothetical protein